MLRDYVILKLSICNIFLHFMNHSTEDVLTKTFYFDFKLVFYFILLTLYHMANISHINHRDIQVAMSGIGRAYFDLLHRLYPY